MDDMNGTGTMIHRLLVANRGEIARRVFATCRDLGIETVAVYSDADADAPHVCDADVAVRLPGHAPRDTYLRIDLLVAAARRAGADAVHPGYGFLSENADFATAVLDAGLVWVGPPPKAIETMGSKVDAKALLDKAGVPMLPTWTDPAEVTEFPVLVKASAGGGGRGMRVVRDPAALPEAFAAARREAAQAFGDGTVFCERLVTGGRHVEVQVFGDGYGTVVALGERDCSIQRRHQKIVEETPAPGLPEETRERMCAAAVAAARAVSYVGAGTVEFLLAPDGEFYFLEMNTRLQVEHPVTECVTGLDLVRLQLMVAQGEPLPVRERPSSRGHAIEVRLYAEDPGAGWAASAGALHRFEVPDVAARFAVPERAGVRLDSGVEGGGTIGTYYDPMLAKLVAWAPTRAEAARLLATTLVRTRAHGPRTNRDLLVRVLRAREFLDGGTDTGFLDRHPDVFVPLLTGASWRHACLAAALAGAASRRAGSAWSALPLGWRNVVSGPQVSRFEVDGREVEVRYQLDRSGELTSWEVRADGDAEVAAAPDPADGPEPPLRCVRLTATEVGLAEDGLLRTYHVSQYGEMSFVDTAAGSLALRELARFPLPRTRRAAGSLLAPMPGVVGRINVHIGQTVVAGEPLLTVEAMKLEHVIHAPHDGTVSDITVHCGDNVEAGAVLAILTTSEDPS
jgi:propionyl-CoA carboxylase alpha chain